jgi:hypothetical protein
LTVEFERESGREIEIHGIPGRGAISVSSQKLHVLSTIDVSSMRHDCFDYILIMISEGGVASNLSGTVEYLESLYKELFYDACS